MKFFIRILLYSAINLGANTVNAGTDNLIALANGDLGRIQFHKNEKSFSLSEFERSDGKKTSILDYKEKFLLINFWALWCAPCVKELPSLDNLNMSINNSNFEVIAIATGRNSKERADLFFKTNNITSLELLFDSKGSLARDMRIKVLPTTIMVSSDGKEVGRIEGLVEWDSIASQKLFKSWISN